MKKVAFLFTLCAIVVLMFGMAIAENDCASIATPEEIAQHVPSDVIPNIYTSTTFRDGVVVSRPNNIIQFYRDGIPMQACWHKTSPEDYFFKLDERFPDSKYGLCGMIGGDLMSFGDIFGEVELQNVVDYCFVGNEWFAYGLVDQILRFWSPTVKYFISDDIQMVLTVKGITFLQRITGVFVIETSPFYFGSQSQDFINNHPITLHYLGPGYIFDYIYEYDPTIGELQTREEEVKIGGDDFNPDFRKKYGIDFSKWGNIKSTFSVDDFVSYAYLTPTEIRWKFGVPYADNSELFGYDNVSFEGHNGSLRFHLSESRQVNCVVWSCYEYSIELYEELKAKFSSLGTYAWTQNLDRGRTEVGYNIQGRVIFAGLQDNGVGEQYTYVFAYYDKRNEGN